MARLMGPVLSFRGRESNKWNVSAIVVTDNDSPTFEVAGLKAHQINHTALWTLGEKTVHRFLFSVAVQPATFQYKVDNDFFEVALPGKESPRMAYASCNGFSDPKYMKLVDRKNKLWETMWERHQKEPYHPLLLGGDQVYADPIWEVCAPIKAWSQLPYADSIAAPFASWSDPTRRGCSALTGTIYRVWDRRRDWVI